MPPKLSKNVAHALSSYLVSQKANHCSPRATHQSGSGSKGSWNDPSYACNSNASLEHLFLISYAMPKEIVPFLLRTSYYESPFIIEGSLFSHSAQKECGARANGSPTSFIECKTLSAAVHSTHARTYQDSECAHMPYIDPLLKRAFCR